MDDREDVFSRLVWFGRHGSDPIPLKFPASVSPLG